MYETKFCKYCGEKIPFDAVICTKCGRQVEKLEGAQTGNIVINNNNNNNSNTDFNNGANIDVGVRAGRYGRRRCNKWLAVCLCVFGGYLGLHKFYEGKIGSGILFLFTFGICGVGWIIDIISLLNKPDPYYVK